MEKTPRFENVHPVLKIFIYIVILLFSAGIFSIFAMFIAANVYGYSFEDLSNISTLTSNVDALIIIQIISAIGTFIVPAFIYTKLFEKKPVTFLKLNKLPSFKAILFTILIFFLANFVLDLLVKFMYLIPFENYDNFIITYLLDAETQNAETMKSILDFKSPLKFIVVFIMIAVIAGLGEELTFRGVFMNLFHKASNNILFAIMFSAFLFAIIHLQLHNLLAIFFMGALLGFIYHITQNLWVSIIAHLFNNGLIVVTTYLSNIGIVNYDLSKTEDMPLIVSIFGSIIFVIAFILYKKFILKERKLNE